MLCTQLNGGGCNLLDTGSRVAGSTSVHCYVLDHGGSHVDMWQWQGGGSGPMRDGSG